MEKASDLVKALKKFKNPIRAKAETRYFKTGKGEYGEGDLFWGIETKIKRKLAKEYQKLPLAEIRKLLSSPVHDQRTMALAILTLKYPKARPKEQKEIYRFYLKNTIRINNWDLVDISAPKIIGAHLLDKKRKILYRLAASSDLWERRISILSTFTFIKNNDFQDALKLSRFLLNDRHDLIHKAVGWMLREIGKKNQFLLEKFLDENISKMPRTTLRYAIEKLPEKKRKNYLNLGKKR